MTGFEKMMDSLKRKGPECSKYKYRAFYNLPT